MSIFALAIVMRVGAIAASRGGLTGNYGYDPSVYYASADAFTHGRLPYRDFVLLHPPGVMLVLTPFAALGRATTDMTGFVAGNLAFAMLGAVNAVLVYRVAQRMGLSRTASWLGGAFYAVWYGAVYAELSSRLEPLGSFAFLCGMLALSGNRPGRVRRDALLAGAALGFAISVKIWWIAPLIVIAVWLARTPDGLRRTRAFLAGVLGTVLLVDGPFFALAPSSMWHLVVLDQLGRHSIVGRVDRLFAMSTLTEIHTMHGAAVIVVAALFVGMLIALLRSAWRLNAARLLVACAAVQAVVLVASPSFFYFYLDYLAPSFALVVAAAAHRVRERSRRRLVSALPAALVVGAAAVTAIGVFVKPVGSIEPFPADELADSLPHVKCVMAVTPTALIELNTLSRDLANNCPQWVDATGRTYGVDASRGPHYLTRRHNSRWQADVRHYLLSGGVVVLVGNAGSLDTATLDEVRDNPLLAKDGSISLYQVVPDRTADLAAR